MERLNRAYALEHKLIRAREAYPVRVLQFGEGNFLRAFTCCFIDILNEKRAFEGSVLVVQPTERGRVAKHAEQDYLYTLLLRGIQNGATFNERRVISCVSGAINPYADFAAFLDSARVPETRYIFSNTTEAGIAYTHTPSPARGGVCPASFPAKLCAWLYERYRFFNGDEERGCLIMPCELIEANGAALKAIVVRHAADWALEAGFTRWLEGASAFANTLVDRVVSGYPADSAAEIFAELGYEDTLLDVGEYFHLFVIELPANSRFAACREELPFEKAGLNVLWTDDVRPYRERKVKILNGAHTSVSLAAFLAGKESVREYAEDRLLGRFLEMCLMEELVPTVSLPRGECEAFARAVIERFKNPFIKHLCLSIALNSTAKFSVRVLPSLLELTEKNGKPPRCLCFALAALFRFYRVTSAREGRRFGTRDDGVEYPIADDENVLANFERLWGKNGKAGDEDTLTGEILGCEALWGRDLRSVNGIQAAVSASLAAIAARGVTGALKEILGIA
ncbi:MAG: tagaturonate reductase [Spirochaetaceae bacterium]|jgi:tagaturonate reductase|nr:tagaturonate reductase [Spirochaetaceae bacterium]